MSPDGQRASFREVHAQLASAQKSMVGVSLYSRWINRPLGRVFAVAAFRWGLSPDQVTVISALTTFSGIALLALASPSWLTAVGVTLLLVVGYALDSADGQVARLQGGGRPAGEWLDHVIDAAKAAALHAAALIHWYRFLDLSPWMLLIPLTTIVIASTWFFAEILTQLLERLHAGPDASARHRPKWQPVLAVPADYGIQAWTFLLLALPTLWVVVYSLLAALRALMLIRQLRSWHRRVVSLRPARRSAEARGSTA